MSSCTGNITTTLNTKTKSVTVDLVCPSGGTGSLHGQVSDSQGVAGNRLEGVNIVIGSQSVNTTNATPYNYTISNIPIATYTVNASKTGYQPQSKSITIKNNETAELNFQLQKIPVPIDDTKFDLVGQVNDYQKQLLAGATIQVSCFASCSVGPYNTNSSSATTFAGGQINYTVPAIYNINQTQSTITNYKVEVSKSGYWLDANNDNVINDNNYITLNKSDIIFDNTTGKYYALKDFVLKPTSAATSTIAIIGAIYDITIASDIGVINDITPAFIATKITVQCSNCSDTREYTAQSQNSTILHRIVDNNERNRNFILDVPAITSQEEYHLKIDFDPNKYWVDYNKNDVNDDANGYFTLKSTDIQNINIDGSERLGIDIVILLEERDDYYPLHFIGNVHDKYLQPMNGVKIQIIAATCNPECALPQTFHREEYTENYIYQVGIPIHNFTLGLPKDIDGKTVSAYTFKIEKDGFFYDANENDQDDENSQGVISLSEIRSRDNWEYIFKDIKLLPKYGPLDSFVIRGKVYAMEDGKEKPINADFQTRTISPEGYIPSFTFSTENIEDFSKSSHPGYNFYSSDIFIPKQTYNFIRPDKILYKIEINVTTPGYYVENADDLAFNIRIPADLHYCADIKKYCFEKDYEVEKKEGGGEGPTLQYVLKYRYINATTNQTIEPNELDNYKETFIKYEELDCGNGSKNCPYYQDKKYYSANINGNISTYSSYALSMTSDNFAPIYYEMLHPTTQYEDYIENIYLTPKDQINDILYCENLNGVDFCGLKIFKDEYFTPERREKMKILGSLYKQLSYDTRVQIPDVFIDPDAPSAFAFWGTPPYPQIDSRYWVSIPTSWIDYMFSNIFNIYAYVHEFGHIVDFAHGITGTNRANWTTKFYEAWECANKYNCHIRYHQFLAFSNYQASRNPAELWAEFFANYVLNQQQIKNAINDPEMSPECKNILKYMYKIVQEKFPNLSSYRITDIFPISKNPNRKPQVAGIKLTSLASAQTTNPLDETMGKLGFTPATPLTIETIAPISDLNLNLEQIAEGVWLKEKYESLSLGDKIKVQYSLLTGKITNSWLYTNSQELISTAINSFNQAYDSFLAKIGFSTGSGSLAGSVIDSNKQIVPNLMVGAKNTAIDLPMGKFGKTDTYGKYTITGLPKGTYNIFEVQDVTTGELYSIIPNTSFYIGSYQTKLNQTVIMPMAKVVGILTDSKNMPLVDATVTFRVDWKTVSAKTDQNGRYELNNLSYVKYKISVKKGWTFYSLPDNLQYFTPDRKKPVNQNDNTKLQIFNIQTK